MTPAPHELAYAAGTLHALASGEGKLSESAARVHALLVSNCGVTLAPDVAPPADSSPTAADCLTAARYLRQRPAPFGAAMGRVAEWLEGIACARA